MTSLIRIPVRIAGQAAGLAVSTLRGLGSLAGHLAPGRSRPYRPSDPPRPASAPSPAPRAPVPPAREAGPPAADAPAAPPPTPFEPAPPEPTAAEAAAFRRRRTEQEATEDSPGAQIRVEEPWPGYRELTAPDVVDRLAVADEAERAVVLLYEQSNRARATVLRAARGD